MPLTHLENCFTQEQFTPRSWWSPDQLQSLFCALFHCIQRLHRARQDQCPNKFLPPAYLMGEKNDKQAIKTQKKCQKHMSTGGQPQQKKNRPLPLDTYNAKC